MQPVAHAFWLTVLVLATSVWVGGYVAIAVVARVASSSLNAADRIAFFRWLGRTYLPVGSAALICALLSGAVLLWGRPLDGLLVVTVTAALLLVVLLAVAVSQARAMTRVRAAALAAPNDATLSSQVLSGGRAAGALRALLGLLSLVLVVLGCVMAA